MKQVSKSVRTSVFAQQFLQPKLSRKRYDNVTFTSNLAKLLWHQFFRYIIHKCVI